MLNITINQSSNIDFITIIASVIGALIAGFFSWFATKQAHENNQKLKDKELKIYEKATALSIVEELKVLLEEYKSEFDLVFKNLKSNDYIVFSYYITQDYTTIFTQNSGEIGLIKNEELRKLIIKSYLCLKRFIEELQIYTNDLQNFEKERNKFISKKFPNLINLNLSEFDLNEIDGLKQELKKCGFSYTEGTPLLEDENMNFFASDYQRIKDLRNYSQNLKRQYFRLKGLINKTYNLALCVYNKEK